jgi:uncharacterized protein (DUF1697 family)
MITMISMLRGINIGSQNKIRMHDLRKLYVMLGLVNVVTYIQSGNVVFNCAEEAAAQIAGRIEAEISRAFGLGVHVLIRDAADLQRVLEGIPFLKQRNENPAALYVTFLSEIPTASVLQKLAAPKDGMDEYFISGKEVYVFCPNGYGRTKLNNTFFERKLGVFATTRNWKTVMALYEMASKR